jgi:hypothetical protein
MGARLGPYYLVLDEEELKHGIDLQVRRRGASAHDSLPNDLPGGIFLATQSHLGDARS